MGDSANALAGMADSQEPMEIPQDVAGSTPGAGVPAPVLAGAVADSANTLAASNPKPNAPGAWARNLQGAVMDALSGFGAGGKTPPGAGGLYGVGAAARQAQGQRQQRFENQQKTQQMSREDAIARAQIAHENVQTLYTGQLMSQLTTENQMKLVDMGKHAVATLTDNPVLQENLSESAAKQMVIDKKLDPTQNHLYPTAMAADPTGAKNPDGTPRQQLLWTVLGDSPKPVTMDEKNGATLGYPTGSTTSNSAYNTLYTGSMATQAARLHTQQLLDEAKLGELKSSQSLEVLKAEPEWAASLGKSFGNILQAQQDFIRLHPEKAGLVPEFFGGMDKYQALVDQQQQQLNSTGTLPKNEQEAAAQTVARKQAYDANPTPQNKALYDRAVDMQSGIQQVVQQEREFSSNLQKQNNEALRGITQENEIAKKTIDDVNKTWADPHTGYSGALMQAKTTMGAIKAGADGNGLLTSMVPTMEVLGVNHAAGISRISPQEAAAAGAPGGWAERWNAWATKSSTGKLTPELAKEGNALMGMLVQGKHKEALDNTKLYVANSKGSLSPSTVTVMDVNGNPDTLAHQIRLEVLANPPRTPVPPGMTRILASDNTFHLIPTNQKAAAQKLDPNLTVIGEPPSQTTQPQQ